MNGQPNPPHIRAAAIVLHGGEVLLIKRSSYGKNFFVFPGGGVEPGETVAAAVGREVLEETSIVVDVGPMIYQHVYDNDSEGHYYICHYKDGDPMLGNANEKEEMMRGGPNTYQPVWLPVEKIPTTLIYPLEIRDMLLHDLAHGLPNAPRVQHLKVKNLRQTV